MFNAGQARGNPFLDGLVALLIYCQTIFFSDYRVQVAVIFMLACISLFKNSLFIRYHPSQIFLLLVYIILSFLFILKNQSSVELAASNPVVGLFILSITYIASNSISKNVIRLLLYMLCLEALIIVLQFNFHFPFMSSTQLSQGGGLEGSGNLGLYGMKVTGLGSSSTQFSAKAIFILLAAKVFHVRVNWFFIMAIFVGGLLTFSRAGLIGLSVICFSLSMNSQTSRRKLIFIFLVLISLSAIILLSFYHSFIISLLEQNFLKGRNIFNVIRSPELIFTGRAYLWAEGFNFWINNLAFGNLGSALYIFYSGNEYHVHNSFLYILTKGGVLLAIPYVWILYVTFKKIGYLAFSGFFFYLFFGSSLGSYGSFYEMFLFSFIISTSNKYEQLRFSKRRLYA